MALHANAPCSPWKRALDGGRWGLGDEFIEAGIGGAGGVDGAVVVEAGGVGAAGFGELTGSGDFAIDLGVVLKGLGHRRVEVFGAELPHR